LRDGIFHTVHFILWDGLTVQPIGQGRAKMPTPQENRIYLYLLGLLTIGCRDTKGVSSQQPTIMVLISLYLIDETDTIALILEPTLQNAATLNHIIAEFPVERLSYFSNRKNARKTLN
jgi:hypothetical protein